MALSSKRIPSARVSRDLSHGSHICHGNGASQYVYVDYVFASVDERQCHGDRMCDCRFRVLHLSGTELSSAAFHVAHTVWHGNADSRVACGERRAQGTAAASADGNEQCAD